MNYCERCEEAGEHVRATAWLPRTNRELCDECIAHELEEEEAAAIDEAGERNRYD